MLKIIASTIPIIILNIRAVTVKATGEIKLIPAVIAPKSANNITSIINIIIGGNIIERFFVRILNEVDSLSGCKGLGDVGEGVEGGFVDIIGWY